MLPTVRFLHSMRQKQYLTEALTMGLMLRFHQVKFVPADDPEDFRKLLSSLMLALNLKLSQLGLSWETLRESDRQKVMMGIGSVTANIPMLCFTEVPEGRNLFGHQMFFGSYGLVVTSDWLEQNGADRVIYVGGNSTLSQQLYHVLSRLRISDLFVREGTLLFSNEVMNDMIKLLAFVEHRENNQEFEWRIAGNPGIFGGQADGGKRLQLRLKDIETVIVSSASEVGETAELLQRLGQEQECDAIPPVIEQPKAL